VIVLLVLGVFFRFYNLDCKVYWVDETHTSLRISGYKKGELAEKVFTGKVVELDTLHTYQRPRLDKGWRQTFYALSSSAEHPPLYFILARLWVDGWGYSVAIIRSLSAVISLLVFPALFWLCWELFPASAVGWVAVGLVAIAPLHVVYAQEARPYSLLAVMTLVSSAALLRAMRVPTRRSWITYGITFALGLYTQLLFGVVAIAHGLYVTVMENVIQKRELNSIARGYLLGTGLALVAFLPWMVVMLTNIGQIRRATISLGRTIPFSTRLSEWFINVSRVFLEPNVGAFGVGILLVVLSIYALHCLYRETPKRTWLFVWLLVGVSSLTLMLPDLLLGGLRSLRIRYLFPFFIGLEIALAYLLTSRGLKLRKWSKIGWQMIAVSLIVGGTITCAISSQAELWWNKDPSRSSYYPVVARIINQAEKPLIVTDGTVIDTVSFSYELKPEVKLQLMQHPEQLKRIPKRFKSIFLLSPTEELRTKLMDQGYELQPLYEDQNARNGPIYRLWIVQQSDSKNR
jgi:uncharacterized membrane protein